MNRARMLVASAFALAAILPTSSFAHAATSGTTLPPAPFDALTVDGALGSGILDQGSVALDSSISTFTQTPRSTSGLYVTASAANGQPQWDVSIQPPTGTAFTTGTVQLAATPDATHGTLVLHSVGSTCAPDSGSVTIADVQEDPATHEVNQMAAEFSASCGTRPAVSGSIRIGSSTDFTGARAPLTVQDFGTSDIAAPGASRTITVTGGGTTPFALTTASIGGTTPKAFSITTNTCTNANLAYGDTCSVTVRATPKAEGAQQASLVIGDNTPVGAITVPLTVTGKAPAKGLYYRLPGGRILDTRSGLGAPKAPLGSGQTLHLQVSGKAGVPTSGASAVVLNLTVTGGTSSSYLMAFPTGGTRPVGSSINFPKGWTGANMVTVPLGTGGKVDIFNHAGSVQVIADVLGFYAGDDSVFTSVGTGGGGFQPTTPERLADTRDPSYGGPVPGGYVLTAPFDYGSTANAHIKALAVNVTAVSPQKPGVLTAWNGAGDPPSTSTLNFTAGVVVPNMAIVPVCAPTGDPNNPECDPDLPSISVYNHSAGSTHILVDVVGYIDDGVAEAGGMTDGWRFHAITPTRITDTRTGLGAKTLGPGVTSTVKAPATVAGYDTMALVTNTTAILPTASTFLELWPSGARPSVSNVNALPGQIVSNGTITGLDYGNVFQLFNKAGSTNAVIDVTGTFEEFPPQDPAATSSATAQRSLTATEPGTGTRTQVRSTASAPGGSVHHG